MAKREYTKFHRAYIWQLPVRVWHWLHFGSMMVLCVTGYYIGNPFIFSGASPTDPSPADQTLGLMAGVRLVHFTAAIVLTACVILRIYWFFAGNRYSKLWAWLPFVGGKQSANTIKVLWEQIKFYLFLRWYPPHGAGHNPLAALSYVFALALLIIEVFTGWALYGMGNTGSIFWKLSSWVLDTWSVQGVRSTHHICMYLLLFFFCLHLYLAIRDDVLTDSGVMSSMITGYKYWPTDHQKN